jgi:hypothetical protein
MTAFFPPPSYIEGIYKVYLQVGPLEQALKWHKLQQKTLTELFLVAANTKLCALMTF